MSSTDSGSSKPKAATTYVPLSSTERAALKERANRARDLVQRLRMLELTQSSVHLTQKPS